MSAQGIIAGILIGLAVFYIARRLYRSVSKPASCEGNCNCHPQEVKKV